MSTKPEQSDYQKIRLECKEKSFHALATTYIFREKVKKYSKFTSSLKFLGIGVPIAVGATAFGYGFNSDILKWALIFTTPLAIAQAIISGLAIVKKWDDELSYSYESASANASISEQYDKLAKRPPENEEELKIEYEKINILCKSRDEQDDKHNITDKEERKGMRFALRQTNNKCIKCGEIPTSMKPTKCEVCGNF